MSELTDLEICEQLAKVKGFDVEYNNGRYFYKTIWGFQAFNPLTDDALCFKLMFEYRININFYEKDKGGFVTTDTSFFYEDDALCFKLMFEYRININFYEKDKGGFVTTDTSFFYEFNKESNRAICLAIIESQKGK